MTMEKNGTKRPTEVELLNKTPLGRIKQQYITIKKNHQNHKELKTKIYTQILTNEEEKQW